MRETDITLSDLLSYCTGSEFYLVRYNDKVYELSDFRLGDEEFAYGIYCVHTLQDVENGTCNDNVPDIFYDEKIFENKTVYLDIADIWNGTAKLKGQNVNDIPIPTQYEMECIKKYVAECE